MISGRHSAMAAWLMFVVSIVAVGCGGKKQHHVSGKVLYNGELLPAGVIWFDPAPKNDAPQGYAIIKNGEYSTAQVGGRGVNGGAYTIRIEGFDGKPGSELPMGKPLFTDFQQDLELPKADSTQNFEVPGKK